MNTRSLILIVTLATSVLLAGCMSKDDDGATDGTPSTGTNTTVPSSENATVRPAVSLSSSATGAYPASAVYVMSASEIPAGANVTLAFKNEDTNPVANHDWVLENVPGAKTKVLSPGGSDTISFIAPTEVGTYTYFCSVPGHRANGLEGTLTVVAN